MLIGVEWTSSSFGAELIDDGGAVLAQAHHPIGTNAVSDRAFAARFAELLPADWSRQAEAVYFSGMVTARNGWHETGFVPAPAGFDDLAGAATIVAGETIPHVFLPGISATGVLPDVMRGEELKAFAADDGMAGAVVILPGAHTKYVTIEDGHIIGLATYMGGEMANLLRKDSLVSRLIPQGAIIDDAGFERGLRMAWLDDIPGGPLRRAFSARSLVLFERMPADEISGYIAGLMVGAEIAEAQAEWPLQQAPVLVVGASPEALRYQRALELRGISARSVTAATAPSFARLHAKLVHRLS
ncbi:2-dehydro-3-deoxygalactonokinase [Devosia neptuniae]|uniref:2-dehydro-3-deoxygalactonokinase n=1 Tax=Devosia neptuniae TaxID=191302 RepID=A0ABY6CDL3_9HYPH|nr:2-dehydro-3-deoxygalactonokinase [Devosia neptuniae]UXN70324.1 2-dehydro-3-deoxygalactonokinase [Devosia neptuniae]